MSECSGLQKHQNNPACSKSVRVLKMLKLDIVQKKKQKIKKKRKKKTKNSDHQNKQCSKNYTTWRKTQKEKKNEFTAINT